MTNFYTEKLTIICPTDFARYWQTTSIAHLFEGNNLNLKVRRSDYATISEGEGIAIETGYASTYGSASNKRLGFRALVRYASEDLKIAIDELANSTVEPCQLSTIAIHDYLYRKTREDRERGYRIRIGVFIGELEQVQGALSNIKTDCQGIIHKEEIIQRYTGAFAFKFMESHLAFNF